MTSPEEHCGVHQRPLHPEDVADIRRSTLLAAAAICEERAALLMARAFDTPVRLAADDMYRVRYAADQLNDVGRLLKDLAIMVKP